jgi:hypothetical protein
MRKGKALKLWAVYRLEKTGKRLGSVQAATEKEALQEAYKQFNAKTEADAKRPGTRTFPYPSRPADQALWHRRGVAFRQNDSSSS